MTLEHSHATNPNTRFFEPEQSFDNTIMVESQKSELDINRSFCELIDNAISETVIGKRAEISITFDSSSKNPTVLFTIKNTTGMPEEKVRQFVKWGRRHIEEKKVSEWGLGGKVATHNLLEDQSTFSIISKPIGSNEVTSMVIENWPLKLEDKLKFSARIDVTPVTELIGYTQFELKNVKEKVVSTNLVDLAYSLGFTYGSLIDKGELEIVLHKITPSGKNRSPISVQPVLIPFDNNPKSRDWDSKTITMRRETGEVKMELVWGLMDEKIRNSQTRDLAENYQVNSGNFNPPSGGVYLSFMGRMFTPRPLSVLKIPGGSSGVLQNFVVWADVVNGYVPKNLFKTGLNLAAADTDQIYRRIRSEVEKYITDLAREKETTITQKDRERMQDVEKRLKKTLLSFFGNNLKEIAEIYDISDVYSPGGNGGKENKNPDRIQLPGSRTSSNERHINLNPSARKNVLANPIPRLDIKNFLNPYPQATLGFDQQGPIITINKTHPEIKKAYRSKTGTSNSDLLAAAARVIFSTRWLKLAKIDSQAYEDGVQRDVAEFLKQAEEQGNY